MMKEERLLNKCRFKSTIQFRNLSQTGETSRGSDRKNRSDSLFLCKLSEKMTKNLTFLTEKVEIPYIFGK